MFPHNILQTAYNDLGFPILGEDIPNRFGFLLRWKDFSRFNYPNREWNIQKRTRSNLATGYCLPGHKGKEAAWQSCWLVARTVPKLSPETIACDTNSVESAWEWIGISVTNCGVMWKAAPPFYPFSHCFLFSDCIFERRMLMRPP